MIGFCGTGIAADVANGVVASQNVPSSLLVSPASDPRFLFASAALPRLALMVWTWLRVWTHRMTTNFWCSHQNGGGSYHLPSALLQVIRPLASVVCLTAFLISSCLSCHTVSTKAIPVSTLSIIAAFGVAVVTLNRRCLSLGWVASSGYQGKPSGLPMRFGL